MDALTTATAFLFGGFRLDGSGLSRRDESGAFVPVPIGARALEILGVLVERPGELVSRDEITNRVWPGIIVENSNLPVQIAALRRLLDNGRTDGSCIQTVPGRGYRFPGVVTRALLEPTLSLPDKPSIAVLPFANMSGDPEQDYFADGMVEEIITALSQIRWLFVIAYLAVRPSAPVRTLEGVLASGKFHPPWRRTCATLRPSNPATRRNI